MYIYIYIYIVRGKHHGSLVVCFIIWIRILVWGEASSYESYLLRYSCLDWGLGKLLWAFWCYNSLEWISTGPPFRGYCNLFCTFLDNVLHTIFVSQVPKCYKVVDMPFIYSFWEVPLWFPGVSVACWDPLNIINYCLCIAFFLSSMQFPSTLVLLHAHWWYLTAFFGSSSWSFFCRHISYVYKHLLGIICDEYFS